MSATNSTTHYNLPSFLGTDKPAWLVDWNGAMASIDSAIYEAKSTADQAVTAAATVASDLATLSGTVTTQGSSITTLSETLTTAVGNINTINGNINTINSLIGNGTPTTTDQTIIGAINEINAAVGDQATTLATKLTIGTPTLIANLASFTASRDCICFSTFKTVTADPYYLYLKLGDRTDGGSFSGQTAAGYAQTHYYILKAGEAITLLGSSNITDEKFYVL